MRSFTISTDRIGPRRWCWVRIHATVEEMRVHAQRLNPATDGGWADCCACFQPCWKDCKTAFAGTLRLTEEWLTPEIVAHELVHAAAQVYRLNVRRDVRLGAGCHGREEDLAYIYGELYAAMEAKLRG